MPVQALQSSELLLAAAFTCSYPRLNGAACFPGGKGTHGLAAPPRDGQPRRDGKTDASSACGDREPAVTSGLLGTGEMLYGKGALNGEISLRKSPTAESPATPVCWPLSHSSAARLRAEYLEEIHWLIMVYATLKLFSRYLIFETLQ